MSTSSTLLVQQDVSISFSLSLIAWEKQLFAGTQEPGKTKLGADFTVENYGLIFHTFCKGP